MQMRKVFPPRCCRLYTLVHAAPPNDDDASLQRSRLTSRFPIIIGALQAMSTLYSTKLPASHGYFVAMVQAPEPPRKGLRGLEWTVEDLEVGRVCEQIQTLSEIRQSE